MATLTLQQTLTTVDCPHCGLLFAMTKDYEQRRRNDHATFYCPTGHAQSFPQESELEKARREAAEARREGKALRQQLDSVGATLTHERDQRQAAERSAAAHRGHATRLRQRAAHGVCPCCTRTFADVARHMAGQHPEYVAEHGAAVPAGNA